MCTTFTENKVLFTKPFQASPIWHWLKDPLFINWKKHCFKNEWILNDSKLRIGKYSTSFWTRLSRNRIFMLHTYLKVAYLTPLMQCKLRNLCTYGKLNYWYLCSFFLLSSCCHPAHLLQLLASTFSLKKENFKGWRRWGRKRKKKTEKTYSGNYSNLFTGCF